MYSISENSKPKNTTEDSRVRKHGLERGNKIKLKTNQLERQSFIKVGRIILRSNLRLKFIMAKS